jgi:hypothetical protein
MTVDETLESRKERAWRDIAEIEAAFERGEMDAEGWHRAMMDIFVPSYLAGDNPRAQSGHGGNEHRWEQSRRPVVKAIHHSGTFLDIGCASGLLMESVKSWAAEDGYDIEPYGLDIAPELVDLARRRLPCWADRIFVGNAIDWRPPMRFDYVRTGLEYVPRRQRPLLVSHLLESTVCPEGRLIIGVFTEEAAHRDTEDAVTSWGYQVAGRHESPHQEDPRLARRVLWLDRHSGRR